MTQSPLRAERDIDPEEWSRDHPGEQAPPCGRYRILIDQQHHVVDTDEMTGRELLTLAGKTPPERYGLYQRLHGGQTKRIGLDETASFRAPGVERFMTLPLDQTEGDAPSRRRFRLPSVDEEFLEALGLRWETVADGPSRRVVISDFPVPEGYNHPTAAVSLRIDPGYPDTQIDMAYFIPALALCSGRPIKALSNNSFNGKIWQQWSRHRTGQNPWRPGADCIETHLLLVRHWLEQEVARG